VTCAALAGVALLRCLAADPACLEPRHRPLLPALEAMAHVESRFRPYALRNETRSVARYPETHDEAVRIARAWLAAGDTVGLGGFQITHLYNLRRHNLTVESALRLCPNMRAAGAHLAAGIKGYNGSGPATEIYLDKVMARMEAGPPPPSPEAPAPSPPAATQPIACAAPAWDAWAQARCASPPPRRRRATRTAIATVTPEPTAP
jgi:hypothetical protein